mmetsp:Transcript_86716/g.172165  ORF Transcript_86716/g.172165 Transcript_86716/m.172165 type:complete len:102 (-) Transcript_86716:350-655(-)
MSISGNNNCTSLANAETAEQQTRENAAVRRWKHNAPKEWLLGGRHFSQATHCGSMPLEAGLASNTSSNPCKVAACGPVHEHNSLAEYTVVEAPMETPASPG